MTRQALRKQPRHTLALPVLLATLLCIALPAPGLADSGRGHGKSQQQKSGDERSEKKRDASQRNRGNDNKAQQSQSLSPQQAAQRARSQYGGQVLKVQPGGDGYRVRLIKEDGRVVTVPIDD